VKRALAFVTSAFSSYSGCRQYREDIARAQQVVGPSAPQVDKLRVFFNHPGFVEPMIERTQAGLAQLPLSQRDNASLVFTAHSIPQAMADGCRYEAQLRESCRLVAEGVGLSSDSLSLRERAGVRAPWHLAYQSRSGPPQQPWLEPDIGDFLRDQQNSQPVPAVVVVPIGFISDHMEVIYDLDTEARNLCDTLGINMVRAATVGTHPRFIRMIRELIEERLTANPTRLALGTLGPKEDVCPDDCCVIAPLPRPSA
jgi:protoporphyrin/coproporphyrin ferrochelatase